MYCFFFITSTSFAQKRASIGLKGGYGFSGYYFVTDGNIYADFIDVDFVPAYNTGIVFNYLSKITGIQISMEYTQKGWIEKFKNGAASEVTIDYLEFPVLTQFRFGKKKSGWVVNFGLYGGYVIKSRQKSDPMELVIDQRDTMFINYRELKYNTFEYGIKAGGGYELGLGKNSLQLELMFTQGMLNLFEANRLGVYRSLSQGLTFSAIYKFTLFRKE